MEWTLKRLERLRTEHATGSTQLVELSRRQAELRDSVIRIEGAITVLEELLAADPAFAGSDAG